MFDTEHVVFMLGNPFIKRQFSDLTLRYLVSPDIDKAKADLNIGP